MRSTTNGVLKVALHGGGVLNLVIATTLTWLAACGSASEPPPSQPPGPVASLLDKVSGDAQFGAAGVAVPDSLVVRVRDQTGAVMGNVAVTWQVVTGGGAQSGATSTNASGLAAIAWTLGGSAGENAIEARAGSLSPVRFTATGVSPGTGTMAFEARPIGNVGITDLYVMAADGNNIRRIVEHIADDGEPTWSPDGSKIAFKSNREGSYLIYVVNADGTGLTRLTSNSQADIHPKWSPDGSKIAFQRQFNLQSQIWVMNADGTSARRVTPVTSGRHSTPTWSPDGARIAFTSDHYGDLEIAVINVDGTGLTRLTNRPGDDSQVAWSPDGASLAFTTDRWGDFNIAVMNADGSNVRQLTTHVDFDQLPSWAPDGSRIVFTCWRRRNGVEFSELCSIGANGTGEIRLTPRVPWASHAAWSR